MNGETSRLRFELDIASQKVISQVLLTEEQTKEKLQSAMSTAIDNILSDENWTVAIRSTIETAIKESVERQVNDVVRNAMRNAQSRVDDLACEAIKKATRNLMGEL